MELAAQTEDARLSAGDEEAGAEATHNQHPNVDGTGRDDRTYGTEEHRIAQCGDTTPSIRKEAHRMRAEHNAQETGGGEQTLLLQSRLQVALDQWHYQTDAHYFHHDGHEAEAAD